MLYTELQISSALLVIFVKASTSVIAAGKMNGRREFILVEQIDGWLTRPISVDYLSIHVELMSSAQRSGGSSGCPGCPDTRPFVQVPFLKRTYFEKMSLRFLAEQGAS